MEKKVTIQDIADSLGLSRNTVSKALNNTGILAEETRRKILTRAAEMGYRPRRTGSDFPEHALRFSFWDLCAQYISGEDQSEQLPAHYVSGPRRRDCNTAAPSRI